MKTELIDVSETRKDLVVEIPPDIVESAIERVADDYRRTARVPGFRPGKTPARLVRQRFRAQILNDVVSDLVPRAVDEALRTEGFEPLDPPNVRDLVVEEGQPLRFVASFDTLPPIEPGEYQNLQLRRARVEIADEAVSDAIERLRRRAARYEPVEDRPSARGDIVVVNIERTPQFADVEGEPPRTSRQEGVNVELGAPQNPPGFDEHLEGRKPGDDVRFTSTYPDDFGIAELAGKRVDYVVHVQAIRARVLPALDDEFAKDVGEFESLEQLRARVERDLRHEAEHEADHALRQDLLRQLATRVPFDPPTTLLDREIDRRLEDFVRRLIDQGVDPRRVEIDWAEFRERQREPATLAVKSALVLDEIARREGLQVDDTDVEAEIARHADRTGQATAALRAQLEKEGAIARLYMGLRRERSVDFLLGRATIVEA